MPQHTRKLISFSVGLGEDKSQEKFPSTISIAVSELPFGSLMITSLCRSSRQRKDAILSRETLV
ncbi:hypothetical protein PVL29_025822 [Vitis rotundifolia]|uniref:Uncharacterized protein n=1 Tax=Vitis rotundifolia TaxID=103349 RepID=A0AA39D6D6_VITRO|nr:hypothetical protein PVL29_025820 [Vitis rotundifolia]KAJ9672354.1 hypothetical protein PVL29_025822 [Vitis rotundifolia]